MNTYTKLRDRERTARVGTDGRSTSPTTCSDVAVVCTTCGMLECLCRPRFFPGQVLTADDLNRLDQYVRGKSRLQNKNLHGWGVVNGLEVTCDACGPNVVVGCGYALSPCGDDIVVCESVRAPICALIKAYKAAQRGPDPCAKVGDSRVDRAADCDQEREWILAVRYAESPTRGVRPLASPAPVCAPRGGSCGCSGCSGKSGCSGCGGGKACGCGSPSPRHNPPSVRAAACEPTIVCEGFEFEVYPKPQEGSDSADSRLLSPGSSFVERFRCCVDLLVKRMPKLPGDLELANVSKDRERYREWTCTFKDFLERYFASKPGTNCALLARLDALECPAPNSSAAVVRERAIRLVIIWLDALLQCFCSALLPPCPAPAFEASVPLASVTVTGADCRVVSVCNWTVHRKMAFVAPTLGYWSGALPFGAAVRGMLDRICCNDIFGRLLDRDLESNVTPDGAEPAPAVTPAKVAGEHDGYWKAEARLNPTVPNHDAMQNAMQVGISALLRGRRPLDPVQLFESVFLSPNARNEAHLSDVELANLPQFLLLNQIARPLALEGIGPLLGVLGKAGVPREVADALRGGDRRGEAEPKEDSVAELRQEVELLREELRRQARELERRSWGPGDDT